MPKVQFQTINGSYSNPIRPNDLVLAYVPGLALPKYTPVPAAQIRSADRIIVGEVKPARETAINYLKIVNPELEKFDELNARYGQIRTPKQRVGLFQVSYFSSDVKSQDATKIAKEIYENSVGLPSRAKIELIDFIRKGEIGPTIYANSAALGIEEYVAFRQLENHDPEKMFEQAIHGKNGNALMALMAAFGQANPQKAVTVQGRAQGNGIFNPRTYQLSQQRKIEEELDGLFLEPAKLAQLVTLLDGYLRFTVHEYTLQNPALREKLQRIYDKSEMVGLNELSVYRELLLDSPEIHYLYPPERTMVENIEDRLQIAATVFADLQAIEQTASTLFGLQEPKIAWAATTLDKLIQKVPLFILEAPRNHGINIAKYGDRPPTKADGKGELDAYRVRLIDAVTALNTLRSNFGIDIATATNTLLLAEEEIESLLGERFMVQVRDRFVKLLTNTQTQ